MLSGGFEDKTRDSERLTVLLCNDLNYNIFEYYGTLV